jgi:hypothetical protein
MLGSRKKVALACAAVAVSLAATSVALATTTTLFNGTTVNTVNFNTNSIKLRTKEPINVRVVQRSELSGFTSGWHVHPGPAIVSVISGAFQIYQGSCDPVTVGPNQAYIETPGVPVNAVATADTTWVTTLLLPSGSAPQEPTSSPCS